MTKNEGLLKGLVIGFLAGGTIGAVLALLYAPKSGRELRSDLRERAESLGEDAEGFLTAARSRAGDIVSEAKKRSDSLISDAKRKADSLLEDADKVLTDARHKAGAAAEEAGKLKNAVRAGVDAFKEERRRTSS